MSVKFPEIIFDHYKLTDLQLIYHDSYIEAGMNTIFVNTMLTDYDAELAKWKAKTGFNQITYYTTIDENNNVSVFGEEEGIKFLEK